MKEFDININRADDFNAETPSNTFISSLSDTYGKSEIRCDCGKNHIAYENCDDDSYRDYISAEKDSDPDNVIIHHNDDFIHGTIIAGRTFVIGCQCNGLKRYENFIWETRDTIRKYLKNRIILEKQRAEEEYIINLMCGINENI